MTSLGAINVGCYLIFESFGSLVTIFFQKKIDQALSKVICYFMILLELSMITLIYWDTLTPKDDKKVVSFCL